MELCRSLFRATLQHQILLTLACGRYAPHRGGPRHGCTPGSHRDHSWLDILRKNGKSKAFEYGQYLGNRHKDFPNIIWMHGNDFQSWRNAADDDLVQAVARGIRSMDANHIHTVEPTM